MQKWKRDVIYSIGLIIFCIVNIIYASTIKQTLVSEFLAKPGVFVNLWLILLLILSIIVLVKAIVKKPQEILPPLWDNMQILTLGSLIIYVAVIKYLGTLISSFLLLTVLFTLYSIKMGKFEVERKNLLKGIAKYSAISLAISITVVQIFTIVLDAALPKFSLF